MMEAARILKAIGVTPRRTIRVALWSGEEQGLLGSKAYVAQHFGTAEAPKPEFAALQRLHQHRQRHGTRARPVGVRPASRRRRAPPGGRAACGSRHRRRDREQVAQAGRHRQHVVQRRGTSGHRQRAGSDRIPVPHVAHEPRHLRARRSKTTCRRRRSWWRRRCTRWRCGTSRSPASRPTRCRSRRRLRSQAPAHPAHLRHLPHLRRRTCRTCRTPRTLVRYTDLTQPKHRHVTGSVRFPQCHGDHTFERCLRGACDVRSRNHACRAVARRPHPLRRGSAG